MKVAILISGYLRSFSDNFDAFKSTILDRFDDLDIYLHFTKNGDKEDKYLNFNQDLDEIGRILNPKCLLCEENIPITGNKSIDNTLNTWLKFTKLNDLKKENELVTGNGYDLVIKWRPDLNISSEILFEDFEDGFVHIPLDSKIDKSKLANENDGYLCDIFAYGSSNVMDKYFSIYEYLLKLIDKYKTFVSESLLYYYLNDYKIAYKQEDIKYSVILSKCNVFAIAGDSGSGKSTLANLLRKYFNNSFLLECDRYHKWERGNENWKSVTHLNPNGNYIAKMQEDIFDLKIGNTIYQVDYDHKTGKFTDKEEIQSSDNLIVCGLHSLYTESDRVYNLKIFIDTDDSLKKEWKIERDTKKRGYTLEKILKQIEDRKNDYIEHILPQRDNSDLVINFFRRNDFIHLRLLISKKFNLDKIINELNKHKVVYTKNFFEDNFNELIFLDHRPKINLPNSIQIDYDYYDYILFIIMNLET